MRSLLVIFMHSCLHQRVCDVRALRKPFTTTTTTASLLWQELKQLGERQRTGSHCMGYTSLVKESFHERKSPVGRDRQLF